MWPRSIEWILLTGNRGVVALGLAGLIAAFFIVVITSGILPLRNVQALFYVYSGLIGGNLTLITVVVSINQLLLSRELQTPDEIRSQIDSVIEYRQSVEEAAGEIAPVKPFGFLRLLLEATREEAQRLGGMAKGGVVSTGQEEIEEIVSTLTDQIDDVDSMLDESDTGTFNVLSLMLETNYAEQIRELRVTKQRYESDFPDNVHESIDELIDRLQEIDIARHYFKSIFMQQELASLSRALLLAGVPAVAIAITSLLVLTISPDAAGAVPHLRLVLLGTLTVGLLPLALLSAYFLRTATVTTLTAATLPFTTPEQER